MDKVLMVSEEDGSLVCCSDDMHSDASTLSDITRRDGVKEGTLPDERHRKASETRERECDVLCVIG